MKQDVFPARQGARKRRSTVTFSLDVIPVPLKNGK